MPLLAVVALAELVVNRLAVPALRPPVRPQDPPGSFPAWHTALDYAGLFLFYFGAALALVVLAQAVVRGVRGLAGERGVGRGLLVALAAGAAIVVGLGAASLLGVPLGPGPSLVVELAFAVAALAIVGRAVGRLHDRAATIGVALLALPLLVHAYGVVGARWLWSPEALDARAADAAGVAVTTMCLLAIASPYTLGPRPLARAMVRIGPIVAAVAVAAVALLLARAQYLVVVELAQRGAGVDLSHDRPDRGLAMYVLALATLAWTLASCALADAEPRRRLGLGVGLVVLGGGALAWPGAMALALVGLLVIVDELAAVRAAEQGVLEVPATPPIDDQVWHGYVQHVVATLRERGHRAQALTTRADGEHAATVIAGQLAGHDVQVRIHRHGGSVATIDARFGRDLSGGDAPPTFTVAARRAELLGPAHVEPPPAGAATKLDDPAFDERCRCRGDAAALRAILDDELRARVAATLEGWIAVWDGQSVRLRIHPGRGASLDRPIPLADLAERGHVAGAGERLIATLDVLATIAARTLPPQPDDDDAAAAPP